jgi:hypothetical protein
MGEGRMKEFMENKKGVHLMTIHTGGEYTMCGFAFDERTDEVGGELQPASSKIVTCSDCISIITHCRNVKTKRNQND